MSDIIKLSGASKTVTLTAGSDTTVQDVLDAINETDIGVQARINDTGDGLTITAGSVDDHAVTVTVDRKRARLLSQFQAMERALAQLQAQQNALAGLAATTQNFTNMFNTSKGS